MKDILIVENDHFVTKMYQRKLSKNYQVRIADNVKAGIDALKYKMPDLIILDLRLNGPTSSGLQVYDYARQQSKCPVLFITGLEYNDDLYVKALNLVEHDNEAAIHSLIMRKPIEISMLQMSVSSSLDYNV